MISHLNRVPEGNLKNRPISNIGPESRDVTLSQYPRGTSDFTERTWTTSSEGELPTGADQPINKQSTAWLEGKQKESTARHNVAEEESYVLFPYDNLENF
jgi:hypothetical protein